MPEVSVKVNIPEGYELACDHVRKPLKGEMFVSTDNDNATPQVAQWDYKYASCIIIRRAWQWPEKLNAAAIVQCSNALWFACESVPEREGSFWSGGGSWLNLNHAADKFGILDFTPPPCDDWRESLRVNSNLA